MLAFRPSHPIIFWNSNQDYLFLHNIIPFWRGEFFSPHLRNRQSGVYKFFNIRPSFVRVTHGSEIDQE